MWAVLYIVKNILGCTYLKVDGFYKDIGLTMNNQESIQ